MNFTHDVAIVGWGPVGKALAIWLLQAGHEVAVVERWPGSFPLPRAVGYDHEIGRLLQSLGIAKAAERFSCVPGSYEWRNAAGDVLQRFDWVGMGLCGWPAMSTFCQPELEAALEAEAQRFDGLDLYRGWQVDGLKVDAEGVELGATRQGVESGRPLQLRARYVVGCDGANSFVRGAAGASLQDLGFEADWLVVDAIPDDASRWSPEVWQLCDPRRPTTVVSGGPGRRRWEFMLLPGETKAAMNHAEVAWRLLRLWDYTPDNARLERHAVYTFRGAVADVWRRGRLMIAGDAAHQMPPFAAQGLCAGLRDAAALAWRLDLILRGLAGEALLESYASERLPHVRQIIGFAIELGRIICVTDQAAAAGRDAAMLAMQRDPALRPPPPPPPRLGPGVRLADDPHAGHVGLQGRVAFEGRAGRFDDLLGPGFMLLCAPGDTAPLLSRQNRAWWQRLGGRVITVGGAEVADIDGAYADWFAALGAQVVLVRPDFQVFGTAAEHAGADALVTALRDCLVEAAVDAEAADAC